MRSIKMWKWVVTVILYALLIQGAGTGRVYVNAEENVTSILEGIYAAEITTGGESLYYKIVPTESTDYYIYSIGEEDVCGYLYNEDNVLLASDDDGGSDDNFLISSYLVAERTYYLVVRMDNSSDTGSFSICLAKGSGMTLNGDSSNIMTVAYGEMFELYANVSVNEGYTVTYQWYENGDLIEDATNASYVVDSATEYTYYHCVVSDGMCSFCVFYTVYVDSGLTARAYDADITAEYGESVTLTVLASVDIGDISYEWYKNDDYVSGAIESIYVIENLTEYADYYCYVTDDCGNRVVVHFTVYVDNGFAVATEDATVTAEYNSPLTLTVLASVNTGELTYQWYKNGNTISGANEESYTIDAVIEHAFYRCKVSDNYGNTKDISFYVYVDSGFTADYVSESNISVKYGDSITCAVTASVKVGELTYQWYEIRDNCWVSISDMTGDAYTIDAVTEYAEYSCDVRDSFGNVKTFYFWIFVDSGLTAMHASNPDVTVEFGDSVTLAVTASVDVGELTYQWYKNERQIYGANEAFYTIDSVTEFAYYTCRVRGDYGDWTDLYFYVYVDNGLAVDYTSDSEVTVEYGASATLEVSASVNDGGLTYQWYKNWNMISGATESSYMIYAVTEYAYYICKVSDDYGNYQYLYFYVHVDNGFTVTYTDDGSVYRVKYGDSVTLAVSASVNNGELTYQWYKTWNKISGATGSSYTVDAVTEYAYYICEVYDDYGNSNYLYFWVYADSGLSLIYASDSQFSVKYGEAVTLAVSASVEIGGLSYAWYKNGEIISGATEASYTVEAVTEANVYTCEVSDDFFSSLVLGFYVEVDEVLISELSITSQPSDYESMVGTAAVFTVEAVGDGLSYQWQYSDNEGTTWEMSTASSATTSTYSTTLTAARDGRVVRCIVTDAYGNSETSDAATMRVAVTENTVKITKQPSDYEGELGTAATFTVTAEGDGLSYQWQYSENEGTTWQTSTASSAGTATYSTTLTSERDGRMVRCTVTDAYGNSETSDTATMRVAVVENIVRIIGQPSDYEGELGTKAIFTVTAEGDDLSYQWQYSDNEGATWQMSTASSAGTATYSTTLTSERDGRMVRCIVADADGNSETSDAATMRIVAVENTVKITGQPSDYEGELGTAATFTVVAEGDGLSYQWQYSDDGGATWQTSTASSAAKATYSTTLTSARDGRMVRCVVMDASGNSVTSDTASMKLLRFDFEPLAEWKSEISPEKISTSVNNMGVKGVIMRSKKLWKRVMTGLLSASMILGNASGTGMLYVNAEEIATESADEQVESSLIEEASEADETEETESQTESELQSGLNEIPTETEQQSALNESQKEAESEFLLESEADVLIAEEDKAAENVTVFEDPDIALDESAEMESGEKTKKDDSADALSESDLMLTSDSDSGFESAVSISEGTYAAEITTGGESLYYKIVPTESTTYYLYSTGSEDTYGYLYNESGTLLSSNDDGGTSMNFLITSSLEAGKTYYLVVRMYSSSDTGSFSICFSKGSGMTLNGSTSNTLTVSYGETVELSVDVSYTEGYTITYQWYKNGSSIENAADASYVIDSASEYNRYYCIVSDGMRSIYVYYYVYIENNFSVEYGDRTIYVPYGESTTLSVSASADTGEISYQWYKNGSAISGATESSYTIEEVTAYGSYRCEVEDIYGNSDTAYFYVYVDSGFTIDYDFDSYITAEYGSSVTLSISASVNTGSISYQWYKNGSAISGATDSSYIEEEVTEYTYFSCYVSDDFGNSETVVFNVHIDSGFTVNNQSDTNLAVEFGESVTLSVSASVNVGSISYQWYRSGTTIAGADGNSYTIGEVTEYASYYCHVTDDFGNYRNIYFYVSVDSGLYVNENYVYIEAEYGDSATLSVTASVDVGELSYRWYKYDDEDEYEKIISGANESTYIIESVTEYAYYECDVIDDYGNTETVSFYVSVNSGLAVSTSSSTITVEYNSPVTLTVSASVNIGGLTYRWYKNGRIISGENVESYTVEAVTEYAYYRCRVSDDYGNSQDIYFYVYVDSGFIVNTEDSTISVEYNSPITLMVSASVDTGGLTYQWYRNWNTISGANEASYTVDAVTEYTYYVCEVSDDYGNTRDIYFYVCVDSGLTVDYASDSYFEVEYGDSVTLAVSASVDSGDLTYQWYKNWSTISGATGASYTVDAVTEYVRYQCRISDDYGNSSYLYFYVYVDSGLTAACVGDSEITVEYGDSVTLAVTASVDVGDLTYQWYKNWNTISGATGASYTTDAVTEYAYYVCEVSDDYSNYQYLYFYVYVDNGFTVAYVGDSAIMVEYGGAVTLAVSASVDSGDLNYQWYKNWNTISGATGSSYTVDAVTEYAYYICEVWDDYGNSNYLYFWVYVDSGLTVNAVGDNYITVEYGDAVTLAVTASVNAGDLTYQWYEDGYRIVGATGTSYTIDSVLEYAYYECRVSDEYGNSQWIYFSISIDNGFTAAYASDSEVTVEYGASTTLAVSASVNVGGLTYQWYKNGYMISGANGASYTVDSVTEYAYYECWVNDEYGNSQWLYFSVYIENGFTVDYASDSYVTVEYGDSATLAVSASANRGELTYQWYKNWYTISGAVGASYMTDAVTEYAYYICRVSDDYGNYRYLYFYVYVENGFTATYADESVYKVKYGESVTLAVIASVTEGGITYQWYDENWNAISGATDDSYTVTNVTGAFTYICRVQDDYGDSAYLYFNVMVDSGLTVTYASDSQFSVKYGESVTLAVSASVELGGVSYAWYKNGELISGATEASYTVEAVTGYDEYTCEVSDDFSSSWVIGFYVDLDEDLKSELSIISQPSDYEGAVGSTAVFTVEAEGDGLSYQWQYSDNGGTIWETSTASSAATATYSTTLTAARDGRMVRCIVTDAYGNSVTSDAATMRIVVVENTVKIIGQPSDYEGELGTAATFTVEAEGDGLSYQWQYSDNEGTTWETSTASSALTATYSTTLTAVRDGRMVRCIVTDAYGNSETSEAATMRIVVVENTVKITSQPSDYEGELGTAATFTVEAEGDGLSYQWQYSDDEGATWQTSTASSAAKATYSTTLTEARDGRMVRCIVTDAYGNSETSDTATMRVAVVENTVAITSQPSDYEGELGTVATFTVVAEGDGLSYQWQYSDDEGAIWQTSTASSAAKATYSTTLTESRDGRMVRCIVTDAYGNSETSDTATMRIAVVENTVAITGQPSDYEGELGTAATFTVTAEGDGLSYQWQYSDDEGATWQTSTASSAAKATYSTTLTESRDGRMVRCIVTDAYGNSEISAVATMTIQ